MTTAHSVREISRVPGFRIQSQLIDSAPMETDLRIGIDIHSLGSQKGGNETYYRELIRGVAKLQCNHKFVLYYTNQLTEQQIELNGRFRLERLRPQNPMLRIPMTLPWRLRKDRLDVFHAQHIVPPF